MLELSKADARRIAVLAQWLGEPRPDDPLEIVEHLTFLQNEPTAPIAPSAELVLWSRLGPAHDRSWLREAIDEQALVDHHGMLRPAGDMALYRAAMAVWPGVGELTPWDHEVEAWVEANDGCRREILEQLRQEGPLPASAMEDTCEVPWRSSGWNDNRNVQRLLVQLVERGEVAAAGREGREKTWDLAERVYPDVEVPSLEEAARRRAEKRLRMLGIARAKAARTPHEPDHVGPIGVEVRVEGSRGTWRVDESYLDAELTPRAALLSPFDRLVFDRKRCADLFEYEYLLEMYKPVAKRRWGYYALPVLYGDRLLGKLDATAEPAEGVLRVDALHWDEPVPKKVEKAVWAEIESLAAWLDLEVFTPR